MSAPAAAPVANASANAKKLKGVSCRPLNNKGKEAGEPVLFNVRPRSANSAAAPMVATNATTSAKAAKKAEVDAIIKDIDAAVAASVTKANLEAFNALLTRYKTAVPGAAEVTVISTEIGDGELLGAVQNAVKAVKASAESMAGGRRKTHRKKHGKRHSKRSKTHKKHGKRSTKHHKKHRKTRGKRSKTHKKRHHKKH